MIRWLKSPGQSDQRRGPKKHPFKFTEAEVEEILRTLNCLEYADLPANKIVPKLADRGIYLASDSTLYRVLAKHKLNTHRARTKPKIKRPTIDTTATGPNQVWCWDITILRSPVVGKYFYLYMIMDLYSRKIVGAQVFLREVEEHSQEVFAQAIAAELISGNGLRVHSDNGHPMRGVTLLEKFRDLGIVPSYSRPYVKNDNAFAESLFRTLKYSPQYPYKPFNDIEHARSWVGKFVKWFNEEHVHSSIKYVTPNERHEGRDQVILENRKKVFEKAKSKNPLRWSKEIRDWSMINEVRISPQSTRLIA